MRSSYRDVSGVFVLVGCLAVGVGCSGGSSTSADGAAGSGMAGKGVLGGGGGASVTSGSAGATSDGGTDVAPENHMIQCGQTVDGGAVAFCDNRTQVCCRNSGLDTVAQADGGAGWAFNCAAIGTCAEDVSQSCNSAANCPAGQLCGTDTTWQADAGVQQVYKCVSPGTPVRDESGDPYPTATATALTTQLCASGAECQSSDCQLQPSSSDPLGYLGACEPGGSGRVLCGGNDCPATAGVCCFNSSASSPYFCAFSFIGNPTTLCSNASGVTFTVTSSSSIYECDSAADCALGSFCCQQPFTGINFSGSHFGCGNATTCSNQAERLCGQDAECGSGYHCVADPQGPGHCRAD
jgi:hypothetical protein